MKPMRSISVLMSALVLLVATVVVGVAAISAPSAQAVTTGQLWSNAVDIPGLASLGSPGQPTWLTQVACTSPGNCVAGGSYTVGSRVHPLFVDQVNGVWGNAYEVPGSWAFDGDDIERRVETLACAPDGGCVAAGTYPTGRGMRVFVTQRVGGVWSDAQPLPNPNEIAGAGNVGQYFVSGSSCSSTGNCSVVGYYQSAFGWGGYTVDLVGGAWQDAADVPGLVALTTGSVSVVYSVSCPADRECSAAGMYQGSTAQHAFVVDKVNGVWGNATEAPGVAALATGGNASAYSISCPSAGNCSVVGQYSAQDGVSPATVHPFVADRVAGHWGDAQTPVLAGSDDSGLAVVSCPTLGNCSAVGRFHVPGDPTPDHDNLFVLERVDGVWATPTPMPGLATLNTGNDAWVKSISCAAPGTCVATGTYSDAAGKWPFVVNSNRGVWSAAITVPGIPGPGIGACNYSLYGDQCPTGRSVSCPSISLCVVVGVTYPGAQGRAFITEYHAPPEPEPPAPVTPVFTG